MAAPQQPRPEVGDILVVIHDFQARSSDELTLAKGDRVELLERDDEFGDGWFLGKHMVSGNTGLFPEVYTRPAPKGFPTGANALAVAKQPMTSVSEASAAAAEPQTPTPAPLDIAAATSEAANLPVNDVPAPLSSPVTETPSVSAPAPTPAPVITSTTAVSAASITPASVAIPTTAAAPSTATVQIRTPTPTQTPTPTHAQTPVSITPPSSSTTTTSSSFKGLQTPSSSLAINNFNGRANQDSLVLHETLNVIDEHITDLRSAPGHSGAHLGSTADSGSEYSSQLSHRMSYIQGEETDEEEEGLHTRIEVESWNPDDVAEYLFTVGVEKRHCEVFRDQEITGDVLLGMDQASLFIKAFELGPVGRRLKTWQKIKALQDEVNSQGRSATSMRRRSAQTYGSDMGSDDARRPGVRSRTNTITSASNVHHHQQRLSSVNDRPISLHSKRLSLNQTPRLEPTQPISPVSPMSPRDLMDSASVSPMRTTFHEKRPSAASVRELHHSRRHSSTDYRLPSTSLSNSSMTPWLSSNPAAAAQQQQQPSLPPLQTQQHKKNPSFDRNWTLGSATAVAQQQQQQQQQQQMPLSSTTRQSRHLSFHPRPLSSAGIEDVLASSERELVLGTGLNPILGDSAIDNDRGYFSGPDTDTRRKPFKKTRDSTVLKSPRGPPASVAASYAEEQRVRAATALSRHSRYSSVDSSRDVGAMSSAAQKYYGLSANGTDAHRRTTSTNTTDSVGMRPVLPAKDLPAPTVTKLDGAGAGAAAAAVAADNASASTSTSAPDNKSKPSPAQATSPPSNRHGVHADWFSAAKPGFRAPGFGLRALSDAVAGHDRAAKTASPAASHTDSFPRDSPVQTPSRTGSTTPSAGPSFELDSPDTKSPSTTATGTSARSSAPRKKGKKETSAYLRGLQKVTPREAMQGADYSGWMKKKSSNLMATWKPRLFVLKGRRLAYYYSEDDDQEKGLIDISFHRVLPADNERLTGLHATITGASTTSAVPANSNVQTLAAAEAAAEPDSTLKAGDGASDSIFIFKLVPPRAGLSRAVNFTKPMVHYFAVPNVKQGRLWMAALMKATIDRDDTVAITTTYQQKTISLNKARQMRHRPPALMNLDEKLEDSHAAAQKAAAGGGGDDDDDYDDSNVLGDDEKRMLAAALATTNVRPDSRPGVPGTPSSTNGPGTANGLGITYSGNDSAVSGVERLDAKPLPLKAESARSRQFVFEPEKEEERLPLSA